MDDFGPAAGVFRQRLKDGRMFAVNRQQGGATPAHRVHEERTAHDQRLFVGQQQTLACQRRRNARSQPGGAHNGGHHGGDFFVRSNQIKRFSAPQHFGGQTQIGQRALELAPVPLAHHHRKTGAKLHALCGHQFELAVGAERKHFVALWVALHHVQGVDANGAGRAQDADALDGRVHGQIPTTKCITTGPTARQARARQCGQAHRHGRATRHRCP